MKQLSKKLSKKSKKILFIGHSKKKTKLIKYIADLGHEVWWENKKIKQIKQPIYHHLVHYSWLQLAIPYQVVNLHRSLLNMQ